MGKGRTGWAVSLAAAAILAVPMAACTPIGSRSGNGEAAKVETGGTYKCACGITKKVGPGAPAPKCCGKPMKRMEGMAK